MDAHQLQQRVTLKDVAQAAGVSTATVTRVFQESDKVSPDTRNRVLDTMERLGYRPNPMARDLRQGGSAAAVGLVLASYTNQFQAGVAAGAERELRGAGLQLIIASTDDDASREPELARAMIDRRVSVLMMMPDGEQRDYLKPSATFGTPVVLVGRPAEDLDVDVVMTEDDRGVEEATFELLKAGHRRIAALAGRARSFRAQQRLSGFHRAMAHQDVSLDEELVIVDLTSPEQARAAVAELMSAPMPPTAVLALNLGIGTGVLTDRITNDRQFAMITLDENDLSVSLGISAVVRDPQELGRQAARLAIERMKDPKRPSQTVLLPSHLRARESSRLISANS